MNNGCVLGGTNVLTLGAGGIDMVAANHSVTINCPVNIGQAQTWLIGPNSPGNTLTVNGNISGSATLSKGSYGTAVLTGSNSFTGTLSAGTGSTTGNDGALQLASSGAAASAAAITIPNNNSGSSILQLTGNITVPPPVTLSGRNTNVIALENISGSNTLSGSFTITTGGGNYWLQSDAGTLNFGGTFSSAGGGTRTVTFMGGGNFNFSGGIQNGSSSALNLFITNTGTLTLANANPFAGTNRIAAGTLVLANSAALQNATLDLNAADTGALSFGSLTSAVIGSLTGTRNLALANSSSAAVALTAGDNNQSATYAGVLSGAGSLVKNGSGIFTLTSSNVYAGATTVSGGTLKLARDPIVKLTFDSVNGSANGSIVTNNGTGGGALNADNTIVILQHRQLDPNMNSWPDGAMTPFRNDRTRTGKARSGCRPCALALKIKPGTVSNEIVSHLDWLPTILPAAGDEHQGASCLKRHQAGAKTFKVHLDGYNLLPFFKGEGRKTPRQEYF